jgi:hypothetical protein
MSNKWDSTELYLIKQLKIHAKEHEEEKRTLDADWTIEVDDEIDIEFNPETLQDFLERLKKVFGGQDEEDDTGIDFNIL